MFIAAALQRYRDMERLTKQPDILYPSSAVAVEPAGIALAEDRSTFVAVGEARRMGLGRSYDTY